MVLFLSQVYFTKVAFVVSTELKLNTSTGYIGSSFPCQRIISSAEMLPVNGHSGCHPHTAGPVDSPSAAPSGTETASLGDSGGE